MSWLSDVFDTISGKKAKHDAREAARAEKKRRLALEAAESEEARKEAALKEKTRLRAKAGRSSTLLTGGLGLGGWGDDRSPKATLLGG